ncbi:MAG TPA: trigger factor [Mycobacteriales bacterium]|nr:trigger factor [Mycobacteriales bacterium]
MKATLSEIGPTKVKLNVEVPFDELKPSLDEAYKRIGRSVKVQGFRPGKVPQRILDQRVGRAAVLEEAIQDAIPRFYGAAVEEHKVAVISRPEVELDSFADGEPLVFSATVDVRPDIELPAYDALPVTVDDVVASEEEIAENLAKLQDRFATLSGVDRAVENGDFVSLDLIATVDGETVEGSEAAGLAYEVGTGNLVEGLDDALVGAAVDDTRTFDAEIAFGDHAGKTATFSATVRSVKVKDVPALDDEFARTASEFDTIAELRDDIRTRLERIRRLEQGVQARDRALEVLLARADVPLPESLVDAEVGWRMQRLHQQLEQAGLEYEAWLESTEQTAEGVDSEIRTSASEAVKAQLLLDAIGVKEEIGVSEAELMDQIVRRAQRSGVGADVLAQRLVQSNQLSGLMAEIVRGKSLALVLESAQITDASGRPVDLSKLEDDGPGEAAAGVESAAVDPALFEDEYDDDHEGHDHGPEGHSH